MLFWQHKQTDKKSAKTDPRSPTAQQCCFQHTTREKLDLRCVLNRFLPKIDGFQWFRIDSLNFRNYQILKLWEFVWENLRRRIALYKWYLVAASGTPPKFILCTGRNALLHLWLNIFSARTYSKIFNFVIFYLHLIPP